MGRRRGVGAGGAGRGLLDRPFLERAVLLPPCLLLVCTHKLGMLFHLPRSVTRKPATNRRPVRPRTAAGTFGLLVLSSVALLSRPSPLQPLPPAHAALTSSGWAQLARQIEAMGAMPRPQCGRSALCVCVCVCVCVALAVGVACFSSSAALRAVALLSSSATRRRLRHSASSRFHCSATSSGARDRISSAVRRPCVRGECEEGCRDRCEMRASEGKGREGRGWDGKGWGRDGMGWGRGRAMETGKGGTTSSTSSMAIHSDAMISALSCKPLNPHSSPRPA